MISICMSTFNGENYIYKQLESIYNQSVQVDEVIICDDCSTDGTVGIIEHFIEKNKLGAKWILYKNNQNKGYPENFYNVMNLCKGDIVFLADQDDIWHAEKIGIMCDVFKEHPVAGVVCCKYGMIDENEDKIHTIMQAAVSRESRNVKSISLEKVFYKYEFPGMVMAFRREWYERKNERIMDEKSIPHDYLLAVWAAEEEKLYQLDLELAYHRRHNNNVGKEEHRIKKLLNKKRKLTEIDNYCEVLRTIQRKGLLFTEVAKTALLEKLEIMEERYETLYSGSILQVLTFAWKRRKSVRFMTVVCDMIIVFKGK